MGRINGQEFDITSYNEELLEVVHQLGELRELDLENYISVLIKRSDSVKVASQILHYIEMLNEQSTRISDKDKKKNSTTIESVFESLKQKSLSPMEKRFVYEEISALIRSMDSISRYWMQKSLKGLKYVGAAGAVVAAALFLRKKK